MLKDNISKVRERVAFACARAGRDVSQIKIVAVSKGRPLEDIISAFSCGISDIGENRVQEAVGKYFDLRAKNCAAGIRWHMVGHLQTNKVKDAVRVFDLIHSVDSLRLAKEIDREAGRSGKNQDILLQIKTSCEETKSGFKASQAKDAVKEILGFKNIKLRGLMTIPAPVRQMQEARHYFRALHDLRDEICGLGLANCDMDILSMGMSDDFEAAIEEGSNMVRIGRAIFDH